MHDIVIVTGSMVRGGAEGVIATVANGLARRGWKIYIVSILFNKWDYELESSIERVDISNESRNQILDTPRLVASLRKTLKKINPEVVLSFMVAVNIVTWIATRRLKVKYIPSERNDPSIGRNLLIRILQNRAYGASSKTVFQTSRAKEYFSETIQRKGIIIPNPVREMPEAFYGASKKIVTAGRLSEQKNHKLLIDAFEQIHPIYPDFHVDIYGEGSMRDELQTYINDKNLSASIHLCGKVDNVPEMIRDAYMFVLPSDYEGLSNALLEAMGIGLPCITTNCAGSDDAIRDGENGLIVPIKDCDAMVKAIGKLIEDPTESIEIGKRARASMRRYNVEKVIDQWEALVKQR